MPRHKYDIILFQPYIRRFVLNFGQYLHACRLNNLASASNDRAKYTILPSFDQEVTRSKLTPLNRVRRLFGIPNVRIWFRQQGDLLFTYGCLVITRKPYCTYIETGLTLYNYDRVIADKSMARWLVMLLATRRNCKQLIFLSYAAMKSFYATVKYPKAVRRVLEAKSCVIYPIPIDQQDAVAKKWRGELKLFFSGLFYMKGGLELAHAYARLRRDYPNVSLTIVTPLHVLREKEKKYLASLPGLVLRDATLTGPEMIEIYRSHDVFVLPTYREGFGLVLIEAIAYGMPVIITDQYATAEMAIDGTNGFVYPNHPLKDYNPETYEMFGRYHEPQHFYTDLFAMQKQRKLKPVEDFLVASIRRFLDEPALLERASKQSLALYKEKFAAQKQGQALEEVFFAAMGKTVTPKPSQD